MMNDLLQEVTQEVAAHMEEIVSFFKPGVKITVLVRTPDAPTRDFCMTDDDPDEVIAMMQRRKEAMNGNSERG
jgi:hypothetical protein